MTFLESVTLLENFQTLGHGPAQTAQPQPAWIMKVPELIATVVEVLHHVAEVPRRAADAMHEQHRRPIRVIRLAEVNAEGVVAQEVARPPHPFAAALLAEARITERHDFTQRGAHRLAQRAVFL